MKIHDKLWYIINPEREDNLAYMTYWEDNAACIKRIATGTSWATPRGEYCRDKGRYLLSKHPTPVGVQIDNTPVAGFNIGSSVSRWTTENKVFRVTDPRGFTVEVPTDNIATLLHLTDVHKGVIQQECIWARDGNSHVLLPVNSEPYLKTLHSMDVISKALTVKDLNLWDRFKLLGDNWRGGLEYIYIGQYKASWQVEIKEDTYNYWSYNHVTGSQSRYKVVKDFGIVRDSKWEHYFLYLYDGGWRVNTLSNPKIKERKAGLDASVVLSNVQEECMPQFAPARITNPYEQHRKGYKQSIEVNFKSLGERRKV